MTRAKAETILNDNRNIIVSLLFSRSSSTTCSRLLASLITRDNTQKSIETTI